MSRMLDNLARVPEEENVQPPKPSLFVVKDEPAGSTAIGPRGPSRKQKQVVWGAAFLMIAALGAAFFFSGAPEQGSVELSREIQPLPAMPDYVSSIKSGQWNDAKAGIAAHLKVQPKSFSALLNQAYVLKEMGDLGGAKASLQAALRIRPRHPVALNNLGVVFLKAGQLEEAETSLRQSIGQDSELTEARVNLAAVFERRREWPQALAIFEGIVKENRIPEQNPQLRERVRRLRSLAASTSSPKEKF